MTKRITPDGIMSLLYENSKLLIYGDKFAGDPRLWAWIKLSRFVAIRSYEEDEELYFVYDDGSESLVESLQQIVDAYNDKAYVCMEVGDISDLRTNLMSNFDRDTDA